MMPMRGLIGTTAFSCALTIVLPPAAQAREATAHGSASASVVSPLSTTALSDLSFGAISVGGGQAAGGAIVVAADGALASYSGSVRQMCGGNGQCQPHPAEFAVRGEAGRAYRVALPTDVLASGSRTGALLPVDQLTLLSRNSPGASGGQLDASGKDTFAIGGTLMIAPGTPADSYHADFSVTVFYD